LRPEIFFIIRLDGKSMHEKPQQEAPTGVVAGTACRAPAFTLKALKNHKIPKNFNRKVESDTKCPQSKKERLFHSFLFCFFDFFDFAVAFSSKSW
jgi:hypothetical protein